MTYLIEFVVPVLDYLRQIESLTNDDRAAIVAGVIEELSRDADRFLLRSPLRHESYCFRYDYPHAAGNSIYNFDFVVDASYREMGVMRVVYVEFSELPLP